MIKKYSTLILLSLLFIACDSNETPSGGAINTDSFDRGALLTNLADNIIIPAFEDLTTQLTELKNKKDAFVSSPNPSTLTALRTAWLDAYKAWQHIEMYNIGEAEKSFYLFQMNVYPTNTNEIETNVLSGTANLSNPANNDAVGFPALDYLLFGLGDSDAAILEKYTTDANAIKYKNYLSSLINQMSTITQNISNNWKNNYRNTFVSSTDNTTSSSLNKFVNDFIFHVEKIFRANKFGIPAGNFSDTSLPEKVEGYYSKEYSKQLAQESFQSIKNTFYGISLDGTDGKGLDDYLKHLNKTELLNAISSQFDVIDTQLQGLNNNFSQQIVDDNTKMTGIYDAIQKSVVLFKVDMLQAFGIRVDYADADGD